MPSIPLPENASIEHLKKQAKLVQQLVRSGDDGALAMVQEFHPRSPELIGSADRLDGFSRSDAQLMIARLYGFDSWPKLRAGVELVEDHTGLDPADTEAGDGDGDGSETSPVDRFVALACVSYNPVDVHARLVEAERLLEAEPSLATASTAAMALAGDHLALADVLDADPDAASRTTGPNQWPPILYSTFSRVLVANGSAVETVRLLLGDGADPNAGFLWHGLVPPFTALTGALGRGESDQPPHPNRDRLARLLLEAGADPNDGQGLYNNGLAGTAHDDPSHLELLHEFGLGRPFGGPWYERFGDRLTPPEQLLYDELEVAAWRNLPTRMRFLVGLDLDLDRGVGRSGRAPMDLAVEQGHDEIVAILRSAGASPATG